MLRECLHGVQVCLDDLLENAGVDSVAEVRLWEVEETGGGRHLDGEHCGELFRTAQDKLN